MIGSSFGHYKIEAQLGAGGMGVVYRAYDTMLRRRVAIKFLKGAHDDQNRARLLKEARAASALNHPNICTIHEVEEVDDQTCIVMEYVQGVQLESMIVPGGLPAETLFRYGLQISDALMHAHDRGIVHRDLKAANVIIGTDGRLKVLDFGLAHRLPEYETENPTQSFSLLAEPETVAGTLAYIAPETLKTGQSDARSDVWSLGVLFYEMASGRQPYRGIRGLELVSKVMDDRPVPQLSGRVPGPLRSIIHRCLDKDPALRYQNSREVFTALETAQNDPKWSGPTKIAIGVAALFVVAIGGVLVYRQFATLEPAATISTGPIPSSVAARRAVAVLGFKNLSGDASVAWLSTALAEMLTTELAAGEQLRTIPGENVARMKSDLQLADADSFASDTLARITTSLGSDVVVFGSYAVIGDAIRFDVRMQDARAGETVAAVAETGRESELFEIVSTIGSRLRNRLGVTELSASQVASVQASLPSNPAAARMYAEGLAQLRLNDAQAARRSLEQAVTADPKLPLAHSALALAWSALGYDERAQQSAKRAYELSTSLAREDRMWVEGRYHDAMNEHAEAIKTYQALYSFFPDNLEYGLQLASAQTSAGKGQDALGTIDSLRRLAPPVRDDPRIDSAEATAAGSLSDYKRQQAAAGRAVAKGRQQGARLLVASALLLEGNAWQELGETPKAIAAANEAREIYASAGDRGGESRALRAAGISLRSQGDLAGAKKNYLEALAIRRDIGEKAGMAQTLNNLANLMSDEGDLSGAIKLYEETRRTAEEIGDKQTVAMAWFNLGEMQRLQGSLSNSRASYDQALSLRRSLEDRSAVARTLASIGMVQVAQARLPEARNTYEEALALLEAVGEKQGIARVHNFIGSLSLHEGRSAEAQKLLRQAAAEFHELKAADEEAASLAVLAKALLAEGKTQEAEKTIQEALRLVEPTSNRQWHLEVGIAAARVEAATGKHSAAAARLRKIRDDARGFLAVEFDADMALGEVEIASGQVAQGRSRLEALERQARSKGFLLVATRAASARR